MYLGNWSEEPRLVVGGEDVGEGWGEVRRNTLVIWDHTKQHSLIDVSFSTLAVLYIWVHVTVAKYLPLILTVV